MVMSSRSITPISIELELWIRDRELETAAGRAREKRYSSKRSRELACAIIRSNGFNRDWLWKRDLNDQRCMESGAWAEGPGGPQRPAPCKVEHRRVSVGESVDCEAERRHKIDEREGEREKKQSTRKIAMVAAMAERRRGIEQLTPQSTAEKRKGGLPSERAAKTAVHRRERERERAE